MGGDMINGILDLCAWAEADQLRATTHNKGIMNGIDAVGRALCQDTRAMEAAAHSYASYIAEDGSRYAPLSSYKLDEDGNLVGRIGLPIMVGTVGGAAGANQELTRAFLEIMKCDNSRALSEVMAAVGLAQNFSALRMLVSFGLSKGHGELNRAMKGREWMLRNTG